MLYNRNRDYITRMSKRGSFVDTISQEIGPGPVKAANKSNISNKILMGAFYCGILSIVATIYYIYLDRLYLVDEVMESGGLRELTIQEKFTIRVEAKSSSMRLLKPFVEKYSLCESVQDISICWNSDDLPPSLDQFSFAHTHSTVTFDVQSNRSLRIQSGIYHKFPILTTGKSLHKLHLLD